MLSFIKVRKRLVWLLCAVMLTIYTPAAVWAEEAEIQTGEAGNQQELSSDIALGLTQAVVDQLIMYGRYESISKSSLYEAALTRLIQENPDLYEEALKGMLESLDDYSEYYTPEEGKDLITNITGAIIGIGVTIDFSNSEGARIASVIPDTPAERAGIQVGDILVNADGTDLRGVNSELILNCVRGEEGTTVHLTVERNGNLIEFDIVREAIVGTSVVSQIFDDENNKLMYIRLYGFVSNTAEKFKEALTAADSEGITNLIIDLRDNGGGILEQAINIADNFVPKDKIITTEDHKISLLNKTYTGTSVEENKYNIVVLINENSASASEVLAAALKENELAYLIGTRSYGKGTIQSINTMMTGGLIKYTSGFYLTPSGSNINGIGIEPDEYVDNTTEPTDMSQFKDFEYTRVYQTGDTGEEVRTAKEMLSLLGVYQGEINDVYDDDLYYAIYAFQTQVKVFPYGVMDITTQIQLRNYMSRAKFVKDNQLEAGFSHFGMTLNE